MEVDFLDPRLDGGGEHGQRPAFSRAADRDMRRVHIRARCQIIECSKHVRSLHSRHGLADEESAHRGLVKRAVAPFLRGNGAFAPSPNIDGQNDAAVADERFNRAALARGRGLAVRVQIDDRRLACRSGLGHKGERRNGDPGLGLQFDLLDPVPITRDCAAIRRMGRIPADGQPQAISHQSLDVLFARGGALRV